MSYAARVIADSISPAGVRLVTMEVTYPRFVHSEAMTHRLFSRNAASSRAIPIAKMVDRVQQDPVEPIWWGRNQRGMQARERLSFEETVEARTVWLDAAREAVDTVSALEQIGLHKQISNRLLEPWSWITVIITATEWSNFFHQRCHEDAQPELKHIAEMMRTAMAKHVAHPLPMNHWHLPYLDADDQEDLASDWGGDYPRYPDDSFQKVSTARCARVSYLTHDGRKSFDADLERYDRLAAANPPHACYDSETEVLTEAGWKKWPDVDESDLFATQSPYGAIEYQAPERVIHAPYSGDMVSIQLHHVDAVVTPNHRMFAEQRVNGGYLPPTTVEVPEFRKRAYRLSLGGGEWERWAGNVEHGRLLGFFIGDGSFASGCAGLKFHLRRERKISFLREVVAACGATMSNGGEYFHVGGLEPWFWDLIQGCYDERREKRIPREVLLTWGREALVGVYEGLLQSDGHVAKNGKEIYGTTSYELAGEIQELMLKIGRAATVSPWTRRGSSSGYTDLGKPVWRVSLYRGRNMRPRVGQTVSERQEQICSIPYDGMIHCVTVSNGVLYVRRNGKPRWCGNSPLEHVATPLEDPDIWCSNFKGWCQWRHHALSGMHMRRVE